MKPINISNIIIDDDSSPKEYTPFELIHWVGMDVNYAYMVEEILKVNPEHASFLTSYGENAAFVAAKEDNLEALELIVMYAPNTLSHVCNFGNILHVCLESGSKRCWDYLLMPERVHYIDFKAMTDTGLTLTHMACLMGADEQLEYLMEKGLANFYDKDKNFRRYPIFFVIDRYLAHQNNYLFEIVAAQYTKEQLSEKDVNSLNVWEYLIFKQKGLPPFISKIYAPLELTIGTMMGKFSN